MDISLAELATLICKEKDGAAPLSAAAPANVIIRTVTHYYTGRLVNEDATWLYLEDAAWIADTGRWSEALESGKLVEVEPYPAGVIVRVSVGAIVDLSNWTHELPRSKK